MFLNKTKFGEFAGVSRNAIHKAIKAGSIIVRKDGKIDTTHIDNADYVTKHNNGIPKQPDPKVYKNPIPLTKARATKKTIKSKPPKKTTKSKPPKKKSKSGTKPKGYESPFEEEENPDVVINPKNDEELDLVRLAEATRLKTIEEVKTKRQKRDIEREELIPRKLFRSIFGKLCSIDTNEFLTLGNNIASEVAGMLGINDSKQTIRIGKFVDKKLYKVLEHKLRLINQELLNINSEAIDMNSEKIDEQ